MSSPLKPVNPIRLKWATSSQHTRELERRHVGVFFPPVSSPTFHHRHPVMQQPWQSKNHPFPKSRGCRTQPVQLPRRQKPLCCTVQCCWALWLQPFPRASLMFQSHNPGNCQICHGLALPLCRNDNLVWFVSNSTHRYWAVQCKWSVHTREGGRDFSDWSRKSDLAAGRLCLDSKGTRNFQETWENL